MKTLIIDNYDSFTFNLFQLVAEINGETPLVILNDRLTWDEFQALAVDNVIISPGPGHPGNPADIGIAAEIILKSNVPVLGICLGHQAVGALFGGTIVQAPEPVHGRASRILHSGRGIFAGIPQGFEGVRYHSLMLAPPVPPELNVTAWTEDQLIMGLEHASRPLWGVQFHPESIASEYGRQLLTNFVALTGAPESRRPRRARKMTTDSRVGRPVVFSRQLDIYPDIESVFCSLFSSETPAFWLDGTGRFSFMGGGTRIESAGRPWLEVLKTELDARPGDDPSLPFDFVGGIVGYWGYELKKECGGSTSHRSSLPDAGLIRCKRFIAFDHQARTTYLVCAADAGKDAAEAWFDAVEARLRAPLEPPGLPTLKNEAVHFELEQSRDEYLANIQTSLAFIREGESYEICLTNRLTATSAVDPLQFYRILRQRNPAPYSAFLKFDNCAVASSSPERFLKIDRSGTIEARPIKGTARRGHTESKDEQLRNDLRSNVKTRSENLMIVDLLRNDLGRVAEVGTVHVPEMMAVETYRHVHQLVSTVRGQLRADQTVVDALRSAFPPGSMTGAPKIRTMKLIDRMERSARGIYSGALGFFSWNGTADLSVVIRTAVFSGGTVTIGVGGAIVALSDPQQEFEETMVKGKGLVDAFRNLVSGEVTVANTGDL